MSILNTVLDVVLILVIVWLIVDQKNTYAFTNKQRLENLEIYAQIGQLQSHIMKILKIYK
jgi:hypothetical protein